MSSDSPVSDLAISVRDVGKCYHIYDRPQDRLKQALLRWRNRQFYREFWALRHIWLDVRRGEAVGIIGRNGSGKSTLLQLIAGTVAPSEGQVEVCGRVAALLELGSGFNPDFTGRENVFMNAAILGLSREQTEERFDRIAAFADIGDFIDQPVKTYSSGMYVRLAFSIATNVDADILIVDEALAVGDLIFQHRCIDRINQLRETGITLIFVSHDPNMVRALCHRGLWLECGETRMFGDAKSVAESYFESIRLAQNAQVVQQGVHSGEPREEELRALRAATTKLDGSDIVFLRGIRLLNETGAAVEALRQGERFTLEVVVASASDCDHVSVGFVIKDYLGIDLTGESLFNKLGHGVSMRAGHPLTVRFTAINNLQQGSYSIALYIHRVSRWDRSDAVALYANATALAFRVLSDSDRPMWFKFRHPFEVAIT